MFQQGIWVGNLGDDPELRYLPDGTAVASFSLAVHKQWTDAQGQGQNKTTWFRVSVWRRLAETCAEYLSKGRQVLVIGEVNKVSPYINKQGDPAASIEVTGRNVRFLGGRREEAETEIAAVVGGLGVFAGMDIPFE